MADPDRNNRKLFVTVVAGVCVAVGGSVAVRGCEEWRAMPGLSDKVAIAQASAEAAQGRADECCDKAAENSTSTKVNREAVEGIKKSIDRIDANLIEFMKQRGVRPVKSKEPN